MPHGSPGWQLGWSKLDSSSCRLSNDLLLRWEIARQALKWRRHYVRFGRASKSWNSCSVGRPGRRATPVSAQRHQSTTRSGDKSKRGWKTPRSHSRTTRCPYANGSRFLKQDWPVFSGNHPARLGPGAHRSGRSLSDPRRETLPRARPQRRSFSGATPIRAGFSARRIACNWKIARSR